MNNNSTVILADGDFPSHPYPLEILRTAGSVICCDGAADRYIAWGGIPTAIVGDCDSISPENKVRFKDILYSDADQDYNDLTKAVNFCISHGIDKITILGATGCREDHTIGNIALLADYGEQCMVCMVSNYGIFRPIYSDTEFESFEGQQVSIFSIDPYKTILYEGLKYRLPQDRARAWWSGTLNESLGSRFTIRCSHEVIVFQNFR